MIRLTSPDKHKREPKEHPKAGNRTDEIRKRKSLDDLSSLHGEAKNGVRYAAKQRIRGRCERIFKKNTRTTDCEFINEMLSSDMNPQDLVTAHKDTITV